MNRPSIDAFRRVVGWLWRKALLCRSHKHNLTRERMERLIARYLPPTRVYHPYPLVRVGVIT
jgi:hypothetical protein